MAASRLRLTGGVARGLPLAEPKGHRLRPTSGLVREALFNILGDTVEGARVLDLYAGTGSLGLEALSRGAASATFIDAEGAACQAILQSAGRAGFADAVTVIRGRLPGALRSVEGEFDLVFCDPPYDATQEASETIVAAAGLVAPGGRIVSEHASRYNPPEVLGRLLLQDRRVYGDTALAWYALQEGE
jgi:16S rRNA (guanine(966)-N(2))-methyltransferase RsmD